MGAEICIGYVKIKKLLRGRVAWSLFWWLRFSQRPSPGSETTYPILLYLPYTLPYSTYPIPVYLPYTCMPTLYLYPYPILYTTYPIIMYLPYTTYCLPYTCMLTLHSTLYPLTHVFTLPLQGFDSFSYPILLEYIG